jgi:hypothetical protein
MNSPKASETEIRESGGELLEGSGFEPEQPEAGFDSDETAEEGVGQ